VSNLHKPTMYDLIETMEPEKVGYIITNGDNILQCDEEYEEVLDCDIIGEEVTLVPCCPTIPCSTIPCKKE
jgi:hypothetical protein